MLPSDKKMVLSLEQQVNVTVQSTDMKDYIDYTTVRASKTIAGNAFNTTTGIRLS